MRQEHILLIGLALTCGIISAKWAMELGCSQLRQAIWGVAGLLLGPLALVLLYVRLIGIRQATQRPGGQWASGSSSTSRDQTTAARE